MLERGQSSSLGRTALSGAFFMVGGRLARTAVTLGGVAILARILLPADFGVIATLMVFLTLNNAMLEGLIDVPVIRNDAISRQDLSGMVVFGLLLSAAMYVVCMAAVLILAGSFPGYDLATIAAFTLVALFSQPIAVAYAGVLKRQHRFAAVARASVVSSAVYVATGIALAVSGFGVWSLAIAQAASLILMALQLGFRAALPLSLRGMARPLTSVREGGWPAITRLANWSITNVDTLFAATTLGPAGAGYYSRSYNIVTQLKESFAAIDNVLRQVFVLNRSDDDRERRRANALRGLRMIVLTSAVSASVIIAFREEVVLILLGPQWSASIIPVALLAAALPMRVAKAYADSLVYVDGSIRFLFARNLLILGILAGALFASRPWGIDGVAAAVLLAHTIALVLTLANREARELLGSIGAIVAHIAVGMAPGVVIVAANEIAGAALASQPLWLELGARAAIPGVVVVAIALFMPDRWIGSYLAGLRQTAWRKIGFGKPG